MHIKKFFTFIMLIILAAQVLAAGAQENEPQVSVVSNIPEAKTGEEFTATIQISGANAVYGSSFKLSYDPQAFEVVQVDSQTVVPGEFFSGAQGFTLKNTADAETGVIEYAMTLMQPAEPVSGDGVLGTVTFRALKDAPTLVTALEASLVSPEFADVDGRKVAQRINQVAAQIVDAPPQEVVVVVPTVVPTVEVVEPAANTASIASASTNSTTETDAALAASMFSNPALNEQPAVEPSTASVAQIIPEAPRNNVPFIAAGVFFALGLIFLTVSVGVYSRMRVRITTMPEMLREQVF